MAGKAFEKLEDPIHELTPRTRGCPVEPVIAVLRRDLPGWKVYSGIAKVMSFLQHQQKDMREVTLQSLETREKIRLSGIAQTG